MNATVAGRIVTPTELFDGVLQIKDGRVEEIAERTDESADWGPVDYDFGERLIVPGFIDVHMHGLAHWLAFAAEDLVAIAQKQVEFGTTGFLPTVASLSVEDYCKFGDDVHRAQTAVGPDAARILGAHFEGPFINPERRGGMDAAFLRPIDLDECRRYLEASHGSLALMTISPELDGAEALIRLLVEHGVVASIGHSSATPAQLDAAVKAGLMQVCHLFNTFEREPVSEPGGNNSDWPWVRGLLDAILDHDSLYREVVCDLVHVRKEHIRLAAEKCGPDRFIAITDGLPGAGLPPGEYAMADGRPFTTRSGAARLVEGDTLVGSAITMNGAFRNLVEACGVDLVTAAKYTATNPATALGRGEELGSIAPGKAADLAVLDGDLGCVATFLEGRVVFERL